VEGGAGSTPFSGSFLLHLNITLKKSVVVAALEAEEKSMLLHVAFLACRVLLKGQWVYVLCLDHQPN